MLFHVESVKVRGEGRYKTLVGRPTKYDSQISEACITSYILQPSSSHYTTFYQHVKGFIQNEEHLHFRISHHKKCRPIKEISHGISPTKSSHPSRQMNFTHIVQIAGLVLSHHGANSHARIVKYGRRSNGADRKICLFTCITRMP